MTSGELVADSEVGDNSIGGRKDTTETVEADKGRRQFLVELVLAVTV